MKQHEVFRPSIKERKVGNPTKMTDLKWCNWRSIIENIC